MAPSQTLPDHLQDPLKVSPRSTSRLRGHSPNDDDFDGHPEGWDKTVRPANFDPSTIRSGSAIAHSRESSLDKLQYGSPTGSTARGPPPASFERVIDPRAAAYGHHRQTSIVHGIQHSRNGSVASSSSSPLSPQIIAAAGTSFPSDRSDMHATLRLDLEPLSASRPTTALGGSTAGTPPTSHSADRERAFSPDAGGSSANLRKLERMHSRGRREHVPQLSHSSRTSKDDSSSVGEYALHVLFTSFIAHAEEKLNECITVPFDPEPNIDHICGPGADPVFDQYIVALGHIAKQKPKPLIDSIMLWRKRKSEIANDARAQLQSSRGIVSPASLVRRNTEPVQAMNAGSPSPDTLGPGGQTALAAKQEFVAQAERRSTVSIYILCRVLLEVIGKSSLAYITSEMEEKLEGIIFGQLKIADAEQLASSPLRRSNWNLFSQLLGVMSEINFVGVTDRFIGDISHAQQELSMRSPSNGNRDPEGQIELVLGGMKHLRINIESDEGWNQACEFFTSLGRLFAKSHGHRVKWAFCQVLDTLLLPVAARATNKHLTYSKWGEVLSNISPRLAQMFVKPRHWSCAFPLTSTLICVSPPENMSSQWLQLVRPLQPKLKDRSTRALTLQVLSRLVWAYLYRTSDSPTGVGRKLDEVMQLVLPASKRTFSPADIAVTSPLVQILRFIGFRYPEYCFKNIIFPLINAELFTSNRELRVEQLDPDRMVLGIRAFLVIMSDLEKGDQGRPPFPEKYPASPPMPSERLLPNSPASTASLSTPPASPFVSSFDESLARPVLLSALSDGVRDYYKKFSEVLGKITIICDDTFGGQAALDEKFNTPGPKTPIADTFNFAKRDDNQSPAEQKQAFYGLLHVAVQTLPRCLSADTPFNSLVNLLCTGTAHVQFNIAASSALSLKAIARQSHAHQVTMGFARFIFNFDDRYATMSDGGMLGPSHIENTLRLYVELLQIWKDEISRKTKEAASDPGDNTGSEKRGMELNLSNMWAEVEHVEARGLFFLCSQSRRVRHFAITVLRLITEFDGALGKDGVEEKNVRLIDILENESMQVMTFNDEHLSVAERSRLQRGMQNSNNKGALIELCTSDVSYDTTLWFKIFPNLIRIAYDRCPFTVTIGRDLICNRILQMYKGIVVLSEPTRGLYYGGDPNSARYTGRTPTTQPDVLIDQWKLYLTFACTTLGHAGFAQNDSASDSQHTRKSSKSSNKIVSASILFKYLIPLLSVSSVSVREAVVSALGSVNINIYRTLLEELQGQGTRCNDEAKTRIHQRTNSGTKRNRKMDLLRTELTHVYKLTSHFLKDPAVYEDEWILTYLCGYTKDLKLFLMDGEVQMDWEFQRLRRHYCGLMEELFEGINRTKDPSRWMTFESRKSSFALMEDWCGFSPNQPEIRQREDTMRRSIIDQQSLSERGTASAAMEIEKRNLRTAALSSMAAMCAGPISVTMESGVVLQFDIRRMLAWIEMIFSAGSDKTSAIGKRAMKNLIVYNQEYPYLLENCIARSYLAESPKALEAYFAVVTEVLSGHSDYPLPFWKLLGLCLFTLGNDQSEIRSTSAGVLKALVEKQQPGRGPKIRDFDISISDKTKAVYKVAQFEIAKRMAKQYPELAFHVTSEFAFYFKNLNPGSQRNMVAVILPWIQTIELKVDPNGGPTAQSYVLLANLLELTIRSSAAMHNEVQALWQALAIGPHAGNVRLILDFIIALCLERREQNFVEYAKQIVVFLSSTSNTPNNKVVEFLLMQITPKAMVPNEKRDAVPPPPEFVQYPYCADLSEALPIGTKQAGFSLGQLSLILLVDLTVAPVQMSAENLTTLLQVVTVLWDHYTPLVQEQAREMLVHLIHELVISKMDDATPAGKRKSAQDVIDAIRGHDRSVVWGYEDGNGKVDDGDNNVPQSMEYLTVEMVNIFEVTYPGFKEQWSQLSLQWATSCPVRHLACRSFQIFRCVFTSLDQSMLGDMLARLSNTIADEDAEIQTFSMEILTTLKILITKLEPDRLLSFPQLFWTTCACLESINEREFMEACEMLNELLDKLDFNNAAVRKALVDGRPPRWDGPFESVQNLLYKGLRSSTCFDMSLKTLNRLIQLPSDGLIGDDNRLFFTILANLPRLLQALEDGGNDHGALDNAGVLLAVAESQGLSPVCSALETYVDGQYSSSEDFLYYLFGALREFFLPQLEFKMTTMLMGLLTNNLSFVKTMTMKLLCVIIPQVDMRRPEIATHGSDIISPLLRLLQTEYCMEAIEVLDKIMTLASSSRDKDHVRMSMTHASSKTMKKEYDRVETLFGIPEESGWAAPMPAKMTDTTRANIHAAFYMSQVNAEDGMAIDPTPTPEVEFHTDEYRFGSYTEWGDRTETMMSDEVRAEGHMGDLGFKLDSLDDFFDDMSQTTPSDGRSSRTITEIAPEGYDSGTQLYDEQILPILQHASSNSTFQNGFPAPRENNNTMNPGAFNVGPSSNRPLMHSRSITSPSAPASYQTHFDGFTSDEDVAEEVFSDGDEDYPRPSFHAQTASSASAASVGPGHGTPASGSSSFSLENMIEPAKQTTRSTVRRLTGGRTKEGDRQREIFRLNNQQAASPQVPKVPESFLNL